MFSINETVVVVFTQPSSDSMNLILRNLLHKTTTEQQMCNLKYVQT
jgi:hypothetical protein